jgi:hypothetical protein
VALAAEAHAAVGADVLDHVDAALGVAHHDDRALADHGALEVARVRHLGLEADVAPVVLVEEALELFAVLVGLGVGHERDTARAGAFPMDLLRKNGGSGVHALVSLLLRAARKGGCWEESSCLNQHKPIESAEYIK